MQIFLYKYVNSLKLKYLISKDKAFQIHHIDLLEQDCSNSIVKALELLQSCTKASI